MHWRERSIREQFEQQVCSHCGAVYPPEGVVIVAHRGGIYVLLASCDRCQRRALFLVSFPQRPPESAPTGPAPLSIAPHPTLAVTPPAALSASAHSAVTTADVEHMRRFLANFDGDFRRLFGE